MLDSSEIQQIMFGRHRSAWDSARVVRYLRRLKMDNKDVALGARQDSFRDILKWMRSADPDQSIFAEVHRDFERNRSKAVRLLSMPPNLAIHEVKFGSLNQKRYSIDNVNQEGLKELSRTGRRVEFQFSHETNRPTGVRLTEEDLGHDAWKAVKDSALKKKAGISYVNEIRVDAVVASHHVTTVELDFEERIVTVATDAIGNEEQGVLSQSDIITEFQLGINNALDRAKIPESETLARQTTERSVISPDIRRDFERVEDIEICVVPDGFHYRSKPNPAFTEEELTDKFKEIVDYKIRPDLHKHYDSTKSFSGFLSAHPKFNAEQSGRAHRNIKNVTEVSGGSYIVFYFRPLEIGEFKHEYLSPSGSSVLDYVKVRFDDSTWGVRIESKSTRQEDVNVVLRKLLQLHRERAKKGTS